MLWMNVCVCVCHYRPPSVCVCVCVCAGREGQLITSRLVWVMNRKRTRSTDPVGPRFGSAWANRRRRLVSDRSEPRTARWQYNYGGNYCAGMCSAASQPTPVSRWRNVRRFTIRCYTAIIDLWWNRIRTHRATDLGSTGFNTLDWKITIVEWNVL